MKIFDLSSRELNLLIYLAQLQATEKEISITTSQIAEFFNISQQTASRCMIKLSKELGLVSWHSSPNGSFVQINPLGLDMLHQLRYELEKSLPLDLTTITLAIPISETRITDHKKKVPELVVTLSLQEKTQ